MTAMQPIRDSDRDLIEAWMAENLVTKCPPGRRVAPPSNVQKMHIAPEVGNPVSDAPRIRTTDRSGPTSVPRRMSIMDALHWAFATEKAQLDFDTTGAREFDRPGIDPIWRGMQMATLGCSVDGGGGGSARDTAADAHIIAAAVETLPEGCGGRRMALMVAEYARAGIAPDWRVKLRIEQDGYATVRSMEREGIWRYRTPCRHTQVVRGEFCPIFYSGTARAQAAKRREYLGWIGALYDLHARLAPALWSITLTDQFPPLAPWEGRG